MNSEILILAGGNLVFLLMAIHLFTAAAGNKLLNRLMGTLFFTRVGQITVYLLAEGKQLHHYPNLYLFFEITVYLAPSCFLLYTISFTRDQYRMQGKMWLAFFPLLYAIIDYSPWFTTSAANIEQTLRSIESHRQIFHHQEITLIPAYYHNLIRRTLFFSFTLVIWPFIIRHFKNEGWTLQKNWIYFLAAISSFNQIVLFTKFIQVSKGHDNLDFAQDFAGNLMQYQIAIMLMCFAVLIYKPQLLYGHLIMQSGSENRTEPSQSKEVIIEILPQPTLEKPIKKALLDDEKLIALSQTLEKLMEVDKLYLNPNLQISDLAAAAGIPVHHCSYILNYGVGKSFRDFINGYRIQLFIEKFPLEQQKKTVEAIALESGFKNIATFYNAFKKEKGVQPYEYMKE